MEVGDTTWMQESACRGTAAREGNHEIFFPEVKQGHTHGEYKRAKEICLNCQVRLDCVDFIIRNPTRWGVWGGYNPSDRKMLSKLIQIRGKENPSLSRTELGRLVAIEDLPVVVR
jgi:WhiB family redox-sensing transcriptional regulator